VAIMTTPKFSGYPAARQFAFSANAEAAIGTLRAQAPVDRRAVVLPSLIVPIALLDGG
jgi:hypothetical protein